MTTTKIKPVASGSFNAVTLTATGLASNADATIAALPAPGAILNVMQAVNEWHNNPANASSTARAQALANANGVSLEDV